MFKYLAKRFITSPVIAKKLIRPVLRMHSFLYSLAGILGRISESNVHPKHSIIMYKEWFKKNISSGDVVLDIGSNTGSLPLVLAKKAAYVYGIEIIDSMVLVATKNNCFENLTFICGDATNYNYDELEPITVVTMSNVLEHIEHRVEFLTKIINQVKWKDNTNKRLLIRVPMLDRDWISVYKKNMGVEWRLDKTHFTEYTMDSFENEMKKAHIKILEISVKFGEVYAVCEAK